MFGSLPAPVAFLLALANPTDAAALPPTPTASPSFCGAIVAHIVPLNPDDRGAALAYALSLEPVRGEPGNVSGTISLYDEDNRWDVPFHDAIAAQDSETVHPATPIVARFPRPVLIDAAHLSSIAGPPILTCIPVSAHVATKLPVSGTLTSRLRTAAAAVAPIDAGVPAPDPAPVCSQRNLLPAVTELAEPTVSPITPATGADGTAIIRVTLADDGAQLDAVIIKSAGTPPIDNTALQSVKESRFAPGVSNCRKVGGFYTLQVSFGAH